MANSKKRCRYCKEYHPESEMINVNGGWYCDIEHATKYAYQNKEKGKQIKHKAQKRAFKEDSLPTRRNATKKACHEYIRLRDKNELCICCNEPLGDNYHAGHFLESGNNPKIRYDEDNIHAQRAYCNTYKGGDSGDYEVNLRKKIGAERVDRLKSLKGGTLKITADELKSIELHYKEKLKMLQQDFFK